MKRSVGIYSVIFLLTLEGIYGLYSFKETWIYFKLEALFFYAITLSSIIGAISLYLQKEWSKYFVYFVSICLVGIWLVLIVAEAQDMFQNQAYNKGEFLIAIFPGLLLTIVCVCSCIIVSKYFKKAKTNK